uniref:Uncharacterized protein n=1 Tax=Anguilla anguilla TaxID=7936 RepID=A0A0E9TZ13_ANGAN
MVLPTALLYRPGKNVYVQLQSYHTRPRENT